MHRGDEFDFTESFKKTLARFESLPPAAKADYYRSKDHPAKNESGGEE